MFFFSHAESIGYIETPHTARNSLTIFFIQSAILTTVTPYLGQGKPPRPCHIRLQGNAATIGAPAILLEDFCPQAILKFHMPSSLDYSAHHGRPVIKVVHIISL